MKPLTLTICLADGSVLAGGAILEVLDRPRHVQMMINEEKHMLLLRACPVDEREALVVPQYDTATQFEMSGTSLIKRIRKITGWTDNRPRAIDGDYIPQHRAIIFNLDTAEALEVENDG